jgi:hypothetical protein
MPTQHPYRAALKQELDALTDAVVAQLDEGHEMPFGAEVIEAASKRVVYQRAERQAESEGHRVTAWMIRRLIR